MKRGIRSLLAALFVATIATAANAGVINFDGLTPGDVVVTIDGVTFSYSPNDPLDGGFSLGVSTGAETSSMANYLGVQDGSSEFFKPGDLVNLIFAAAISQLDVTFIAPSGTPDGAFGISSGPDFVLSSSLQMVLLSTGDEAFTVHFAPSSPFLAATLFSDASSAPLFSIDDITTPSVPIPGTAWLLAVAALAFVVTRRARRRTFA